MARSWFTEWLVLQVFLFQEILPEGWEVPSSFETIGHIAHLNLRDEYAPYKHVIGQVRPLSEFEACKAVFNCRSLQSTPGCCQRFYVQRPRNSRGLLTEDNAIVH
jgi:tRNA G37 N-methylase Trm5